jgi:Icc-related predicted phosphoesterase
MLFLGDIHHLSFPVSSQPIYCVGDCGVGFPGMENRTFPTGSKFIAGNHDNRKVCETKYSDSYLGHYGVDSLTGIFFVSGEWSIDREYRTEGVDWWNWEELSMEEAYACYDLYIQTRPSIVLSHGCPSSVIRPIFKKDPISTRTGQLLDSMFQSHKPDIWIFGHFHESKQMNILGTEFHCLGIKEIRDIAI